VIDQQASAEPPCSNPLLIGKGISVFDITFDATRCTLTAPALFALTLEDVHADREARQRLL
jgi:hypothetical protein